MSKASDVYMMFRFEVAVRPCKRSMDSRFRGNDGGSIYLTEAAHPSFPRKREPIDI